jgi:hypothetical protein
LRAPATHIVPKQSPTSLLLLLLLLLQVSRAAANHVEQVIYYGASAPAAQGHFVGSITPLIAEKSGAMVGF